MLNEESYMDSFFLLAIFSPHFMEVINMTKETQSIIEELKKVVHGLHRSAGYLDSIIESFERPDTFQENSEYNMMFIMMQRRHLNALRTTKGCINLDERERDLFDRLIKSVKNEKP